MSREIPKKSMKLTDQQMEQLRFNSFVSALISQDIEGRCPIRFQRLLDDKEALYSEYQKYRAFQLYAEALTKTWEGNTTP